MESEKYLIRKLNTFYMGLNKTPILYNFLTLSFSNLINSIGKSCSAVIDGQSLSNNDSGHFNSFLQHAQFTALQLRVILDVHNELTLPPNY